MGRKSCNYLSAAVEECGNGLIGDCYSEEEVNQRKDTQVKGILKQLEATVEEWDSSKCPPVMAYLDREAAKEAGDAEPEAESEAEPEPEAEAEPESEGEPEAEADPDDDDEAGDDDGDIDGEDSDDDDGDESASPSVAASVTIVMLCLALF